MADLITKQQAQSYAEPSKMSIATLDSELLGNIQGEVLARVDSVHDTTTWVDPVTTPDLVRTVITMLYVSWLYHRTYSEDEGDNEYAVRLAEKAEALIMGIIDGTIDLPGIDTGAGQPSFYPTDASSALEPTADDPSLGPAKFSMGQVW